MRRRSLFEEFFGRDFDDFFDSQFSSRPHRLMLSSPSGNLPTERDFYRSALADVWEEGNKVMARIEVPGVKKEDINLNINDDLIEIKAEKKSEKEDKGKDFYRFERSYAGFYRTIPLSQKIDANKAEATYKDGVLEISAPKLAGTNSTKRIEIK